MKKIIHLALSAMLFALSPPVEAQQAKNMARIGYLSSSAENARMPKAVVAAFKEGLRKLGWVEGKNIRFEFRYAEGQLDKLPEFAAELVQLKVDVIVTAPGTEAALAAKGATTTIPIVMVAAIDPVGVGVVASLARPGGNVTGLSWDVTPEQAGRNLEILKEAAPKVSRVAILRSPNASHEVTYSEEAERAAKTLGVTLRFAEVKAPNRKDLEDALGDIVRARANALLVVPSAFFPTRRQQITDFAARNKLPAIYPGDVFVDNGGLMSYGPNYQDVHRRAVTYVDKILKGTKPSDLPVEQPMKLELVINLKTAKQIGLTIPQWTLMKADRVIK
ncbi:MAG: ABC transporter substrate-binding protein [Candidatus Binatia bacterium]|nr:ABC transporter substrate-binding protein [Candidatus Binatia bacterium]